ncbi:MAG: FAD:protein FMN transferase [Limnochordaceae bacterium]|nr:FAD:protein FMN transferase [Limnochordaceae bacterium]
MGTTITLMVRPASGKEDAARRALAERRAWFEEVERALSRFRPDSELSRLNRAGCAGQWCLVSPLLFWALEAAQWAYEATGGLVDAGVLPALARYGYDRDWHALGGSAGLLPPGDEAEPPAGARPAGRPPFELDRAIRAVRIRPGAALDLGGVVKGLAADSAAAWLAQRFGAALVDAGGDVAARALPGSPPWVVQVDGSPIALEVRQGGVATSGLRRWWVGPLGPAHHLIDPGTGAPVRTDVVSATVAESGALRAEVLAKALILAGSRRIGALMERWPHASAFVRLRDGRALTWGVPLAHAS